MTYNPSAACQLQSSSQVDYPRKCLHLPFEAQAKKKPEGVALSFKEKEITYQDLDYRANQLAHYLRKLGVEPEVFVGLYMERSIEWAVGILGILKAGGVCVLLDPIYPREQLKFILDDSQVPVLLTHKTIQKTLPQNEADVICIDPDWHIIGQESREPLKSEVEPENLAYISYTSGSTGRPKGVMMPHIGYSSDFKGQIPSQLTEGESRLIKSRNIFELLLPLWAGGTGVIIPHGKQKDSKYLLSQIVKHNITEITFFPVMLEVFLREDEIDKCNCLKRVYCAGENLSVALQQRFFKCLPNCLLYNYYGLTEAASFVSLWRCKYGSNNTTVPVGRPAAGVQLYLLDSKLQTVPTGEPGELCISSSFLARGYLNQPELTSKKFIENPFSNNRQDSRLFKTGDKARCRRDGTIELLGRIDNQIKLRGFRIEPGEIETILVQHSSVQKAVIIAREDNPNNKYLAAYVTLEQKQHAAPHELRSFLKEKLPDYMIPSAFVILDAFPLTPNGKVDRRALPEPDPARRELDTELIPPRNATEKILISLWNDLLKLEQIGIYDNFFDLGGNSILAATLLVKVKNHLGKNLALITLFQAQTVADQAKIIRQSSSLASLKPCGSPKVALQSLSFAQERIHLLQRLEPKSPAYNKSVIRRLKGSLNIAALEQSVQEILRRHEVLRTTLPAHKLMPIRPEQLLITDCRSFSEPATEVRRLIGEEMRKPFDLSTGPLLRTHLFILDIEDHVLFLGTHQICCDDQSTGILLQELTALYTAFAQGQPSPLPDPPVQYADFAHWQRNWLQGKVLEEQLDFWREQLQPAVPHLNLSTTTRHSRAVSRSLDIPAWLHEPLRTLSRQEGVTLFMTLLAAFKTLLFRYTLQEDIMVFSSVGGRNRTEIRGLIGLFANVLALRTDLSGSLTFRELLSRVRETAMGAFSHQDLPFDRLLNLLHHSGAGQAPPLQMLFVLQNASMPDLELPGVQVEPFQADTEGTSQFDMVCYFKETDAGLTAWLRYKTELSTLAAVISENMSTLLEGIVDNPDQRLTVLPCLSEEELQQRVPEFINQEQSFQEADMPDAETYVAPRDPLEKQLATIWEEKLEIQPIGIHDHFDKIGGSSLLAALVLTETEKALNKQIPFATLYKAPTIAQWAEILRRQKWTDLRSDKSELHFFLPGAGAKSLAYFELKRFLDINQENEIRALPMNLQLTRLTTLEEIAASYVEQIRSIQPDGPYFLGSRRCSAIVTYEVAQQLYAQRQKVAFLGIIDYNTPVMPRTKLFIVKSYFQQMVMLLRTGQMRTLLKRISNVIIKSKVARKLSYEITDKVHSESISQFNYMIPNCVYEAKPYPGKVTLFFSDYYMKNIFNKRNGTTSREEWSKIALGGVDFNLIASDHMHPDMFHEPHAHILAEKLKACLDEN